MSPGLQCKSWDLSYWLSSARSTTLGLVGYEMCFRQWVLELSCANLRESKKKCNYVLTTLPCTNLITLMHVMIIDMRVKTSQIWILFRGHGSLFPVFVKVIHLIRKGFLSHACSCMVIHSNYFFNFLGTKQKNAGQTTKLYVKPTNQLQHCSIKENSVIH